MGRDMSKTGLKATWNIIPRDEVKNDEGTPYYFVHTLDHVVFKLLMKKAKRRAGYICYVVKSISKYQERVLTSVFKLEHIGIQFNTGLLWRFQEECYKMIESIMNNSRICGSLRKYSEHFDVTWKHMEVAFKKVIFRLIMEDYEIVFFGNILHPDKKRISLVKEKTFVRLINKDIELIEIKYGKKVLIRIITHYCYLIGKIIKRRRKKKNYAKTIRNGVVFEQIYLEQFGGNPEFQAFYDYFKTRSDVIYVCPQKKGGIYRILRKDRKPVVCFRWHEWRVGNKIGALRNLILLLIQQMKGKESIGLKRDIIILKSKELYYQSFFKTYSPKYYLRIRADMDVFHPIATGICEKRNVLNIGYQHGSYPFFHSGFSWIDFYAYGIWGEGFRSKVFEGVWEKNVTLFPIIGPFTSISNEYKNEENRLKTKLFYDKINKGRLNVTLFAGPAEEDDYIGLSEYTEFLTSCYKILSKTNYNIIFKEKYNQKREDLIEKSLRNKYDLEVEKVYHQNVKNYLSLSPTEVIKISDVVIARTISSIGWQALSFQKKLIIFESEAIEHPFEKSLSRIIVRNERELDECLKWLTSISQTEYEMIIDPLIKEWAKINNGQLVADFWNEVESSVE